MNYYSRSSHDGIHFSNTQANLSDISDAIEKRFAQMEALTTVGMFCDDSVFKKGIAANYFWVIQDVAQEIRVLHERLQLVIK